MIFVRNLQLGALKLGLYLYCCNILLFFLFSHSLNMYTAVFDLKTQPGTSEHNPLLIQRSWKCGNNWEKNRFTSFVYTDSFQFHYTMDSII